MSEDSSSDNDIDFYDADEGREIENSISIFPEGNVSTSTTKKSAKRLSLDHYNGDQLAGMIISNDCITSESFSPPSDLEFDPRITDDLKFRVIDKDSGLVMDIRTLEKDMPDNQMKYSTLLSVMAPTASHLDERKNSRAADAEDNTDTCSTSTSNTTSSVFQILRNVAGRWSMRQGKSKSADFDDNVASKITHNGVSGSLKISLVQKDNSDFVGLKLAQTLTLHTGPIWTAKFSLDGKYLATSGQDARVIIWTVGSPCSLKEPPPPRSSLRVARARSTTALSQFSKTTTASDFSSAAAAIASLTTNDSDDSLSSPTKPSAASKTASAFASPRKQENPTYINVKRTASGTSIRSSSSNASATPPPIAFEQSPQIEATACPRPSFKFFDDEPFRVFQGHAADVIDVSWSASAFLLSASLDKTIRMWHVSKRECLQLFRHADFVTSVDFHPTNDRFFVSGCFDKKIRLWDIIPDGHVLSWAQTPEFVTSVAFSPDGRLIAAGLYHGQVVMYEYEGMRYYTQLECRNHRGRNRSGRKVTGIHFIAQPHSRRQDSGDASSNLSPDTSVSDILDILPTDREHQDKRQSVKLSPLSHSPEGTHILVTTNDSRVRLFRLNDYSLVAKYKGVKNDSMQLRASVSEDGKYVISGSEDGNTVIWNSDLFRLNSSIDGRPMRPSGSFTSSNDVIASQPSSNRVKKEVHIKSCEKFKCALGKYGVATVSIFAPVNAVAHAVEISNVYTIIGIEDLESKVIVTADYMGSLKVFVRGDFPEKYSE